MANLSAIKLPNGTTYNLKDNGALQLTGGSVTGPVSFGDSVSIDEATVGDLVVNGSASFTNNIQANTINGVAVGSSPKFTDTTYSSLAAASGGTTVSLVTTGEKYMWNSKTSNTGTITSVKTTAGTHTTINVSSGVVTFNVPTKTSHLTNDSNFITLDNIGVSNGLISITYNGIKTISSTNFNLVNGSQTGSLRTIGSTTEDSSYTIGLYAFAEGDSTKAIGNDSHAEGYKTTANGFTAHAEGSATLASNSYSHAQNRGTIASKECQTAIGKYNIEDTATAIANQKALIIGNGTFSERSNALTVDWFGNTEQQGRATTNDMSATDISSFVNNLNFRQSSLIDFFYPVGSYYETSDISFDPNIAWGGTWNLEAEGQVHISAGTNYTVGGALTDTTDGGSEFIQEHAHIFTNPTYTTAGAGSHSHAPGVANRVFVTSTSGVEFTRHSRKQGTGAEVTYLVKSTQAMGYSSVTDTEANHSHAVNLNSNGVVGVVSGETTGNAGNMPPYIVVNRWHRTA